MGPIEIVFIVVWAIFGSIGLVRGVWRELGVTTMMLIALLLVQLLTTQFGARWDAVLGLLILDPSTHFVVKNLLALAFTVVMAFISYQGETFNFPGKGNNWFFSLGAGLLNGYLLAGSAWYYLQAAWLAGRAGGRAFHRLLPGDDEAPAAGGALMANPDPAGSLYDDHASHQMTEEIALDMQSEPPWARLLRGSPDSAPPHTSTWSASAARGFLPSPNCCCRWASRSPAPTNA